MGAGALSGYALAKTLTRTAELPSASRDAHIVILGAGFGGLAAALQLSKFSNQLRITVVDRHNYHLFTPLLYQAATCGIVPYDAALPVRQWSPASLAFLASGCSGYRSQHTECAL